MVGLHLGWGPMKTELVLPPSCDPDDEILLPRDNDGRPLPNVVQGFKACLGAPRHPTNDGDFIMSALDLVVSRHDSLLDLISDVAEEDPCAALGLLQICGVNKFGHIISAVPPEMFAGFCV